MSRSGARANQTAHQQQLSSTLPPLRNVAGTPHTLPLAMGAGSAAEAALAFDFEMRATVSATGGAGGIGLGMGAGAAGNGGASAAAGKVAGSRVIARQLASSASMSSLPRSGGGNRPTTPLSPVVLGSMTPLPSHLHSTADKLAYYIGSSSSGEGPSSVAGVLTPRTRYERLAQSVAAVPFPDTPIRAAAATAATNIEETKEQRHHALHHTAGGRTLGSSASSPALLHSQPLHRTQPLLSASPSHSSLHRSGGSLASLHHGYPHGHSTSTFVRPTAFLNTFMPSTTVAGPTAEENARAKLLEQKFAALLGQRKLRKKAAHAGKRRMRSAAASAHARASSSNLADGSALSFAPRGDSAGMGGGSSEELSSSDDDLDDDPLAGLPKRKAGAGQQLLAQIQAVIRAVADEKAEALQHAHSHAHSKSMDKKKSTTATTANSDEEDDTPARTVASKPTMTAEEVSAAQKAEQATLQSVIQAYMESTGLAGSVAAGGASSAGNVVSSSSSSGGGGGTIKDREGSSSTFTTAKLTRDVKLVLDYLKSNPVMLQDLQNRIRARQEQKRAKAARAALLSGTMPGALDKVELNRAAAWTLTEEVREQSRLVVLRQEHARIRAQQERKAAIDAFWLGKARERDAAIMSQFGPEMQARRQRENAENLRLGRVQLGWAMFAHLIPLTLRFKWKLKEIVHARVQRQVSSFLVPLLKRNYVLTITSKLNETRAAALATIKRVLVRYVSRWRWLKRRNACVHLWRFFALVKNARAIRNGLKDSSLRSQILKIQQWWRGQLYGVLEGQVGLVEMKWNRREQELVQTWARKQKRDAALAAKHDAGRGAPLPRKPLPAHLLGPGGERNFPKGSPSSKRHHRGVSTGGSNGDFSRALATLHGPGSDDSLQLAPKRVPRAQKREAIGRFVRRRRAAHRAALRAYVHELARWHADHKHELELHKARRELGLRQGGAGGGPRVQEPPPPALVPPSRPVLRILPGQSELDHMILTASRQYVLGKLRGATMGAGGGGGGGGGDESAPSAPGSSSMSMRRLSQSVQPSSGSLAHGGSSSSSVSSATGGGGGGGGNGIGSLSSLLPSTLPPHNPLIGFVSGNAHVSVGMQLKSMTVGETQKARRDMQMAVSSHASRIDHSTLEEGEESQTEED